MTTQNTENMAVDYLRHMTIDGSADEVVYKRIDDQLNKARRATESVEGFFVSPTIWANLETGKSLSQEVVVAIDRARSLNLVNVKLIHDIIAKVRACHSQLTP